MSWQDQLRGYDKAVSGKIDVLDLPAPNDSDRVKKRGLPRFDLDQLDGDPPPDRDWILPGFIPAGEVTLFTGPGGAGKSLFAQKLATCVAAQVPFLGPPTIELPDEAANAVLYVTCEDDEAELHRRNATSWQRWARAARTWPIGFTCRACAGVSEMSWRRSIATASWKRPRRSGCCTIRYSTSAQSW